jgi:hypothetical protein
LYKNRDKHGAIDVTSNIVLFHTIAKNANLPEHHTETAIGELLYVPTKNARVELCAPEKIDNEVSIGSRVLG